MADEFLWRYAVINLKLEHWHIYWHDFLLVWASSIRIHESAHHKYLNEAYTQAHAHTHIQCAFNLNATGDNLPLCVWIYFAPFVWKYARMRFPNKKKGRIFIFDCIFVVFFFTLHLWAKLICGHFARARSERDRDRGWMDKRNGRAKKCPIENE